MRVNVRRRLARCDWCGGRSKRHDKIAGNSHSDCASIAHAHTMCVCGSEGRWPNELGGYEWGTCATCGKFRGWLSPAERVDPEYPGLHANRLMAAIPVGQRAPEVMAIVQGMWDHYRRVSQ